MAVLVPFPEFSNKSLNSTTTTTAPTTNSTPTPAPEPAPSTSSWQEQARAMPDVMAFIASNQIINAIKLVRERLGCGLKDAKDTVDAINAQT